MASRDVLAQLLAYHAARVSFRYIWGTTEFNAHDAKLSLFWTQMHAAFTLLRIIPQRRLSSWPGQKNKTQGQGDVHRAPRAGRARPTEARLGREGAAGAMAFLQRQTEARKHEAVAPAGKGQAARGRHVHTEVRPGVSLQASGGETRTHTLRDLVSPTLPNPRSRGNGGLL